MATPPKLEYAEFFLIDPTRLAEGVEAATVMTIGGLIRGSYFELEGTPAQLASAVNHNLADLDHTVAGRRRLQARAQTEGTWLLYYCSLCGARLGPRRCLGCGRTYTADVGMFGSRQATMPRKVAAYAISRKHTFERRR